MIQYNIDFFDSNLEFKYNAQATDLSIDEDYLTISSNQVVIPPTTAVETRDFIRVDRGDSSFFGVVSSVEPGEKETKVIYKPFVSLFDEDILFDVRYQNKTVERTVDGVKSKVNQYSLETVIKRYIDSYYVSASDTNQNLSMSVSVRSETLPWTLDIYPDNDYTPYSIRGLYKEILVPAMKQYGIALNVVPDFNTKHITVTISKSSFSLDIDGDLDNVIVKTLKYNDKPVGTNKLEVYNAYDASQPPVIFYVHPDRTWDVEDKNRIVPVARSIRMVMPDSETEDEPEAMALAALDAADSELSGLEWDNLIELETSPADELIDPMNLEFGQSISLWYKQGKYVSILTGKSIMSDAVTLIFGSERVKFTKRIKL